tara:strand:+ start:1561 stop:1797 length:237 start_codon:yes stop_codon:yes gene_type:complete
MPVERLNLIRDGHFGCLFALPVFFLQERVADAKTLFKFSKARHRAKTLQMLFSGLIYYLAQFLHQLPPSERFTTTEVA